jgi:hypothetical protein
VQASSIIIISRFLRSVRETGYGIKPLLASVTLLMLSCALLSRPVPSFEQLVKPIAGLSKSSILTGLVVISDASSYGFALQLAYAIRRPRYHLGTLSLIQSHNHTITSFKHIQICTFEFQGRMQDLIIPIPTFSPSIDCQMSMLLTCSFPYPRRSLIRLQIHHSMLRAEGEK